MVAEAYRDVTGLIERKRVMYT